MTPGTVLGMKLEAIDEPARLLFFAPPGEAVVEDLGS